MQNIFLLLCAFLASTTAFAQKQVYIPNYLKDVLHVDGAQFTLDKTAQSENFILIWGNTVGTDPASYPDPDLAFQPQAVLDTMEYIYTQFKNYDFLDDSPGTKLNQYKIVVVVLGTWGPDGAQGWAFGGDVDGVIGAFWVHPNAIRDGGVAAHEFTHSLQAQNNIDYRATHGLGGAWYNAGIFWETHANYMRNLLYPQAVSAWGMDIYHLETWGDWKNTYENYQLLMAIHLSEGPGMVSRLWRESYSEEYPLQTYKRINGYSQMAFNDSLFHYARRMATYDFDLNGLGSYFRQYRNNDLQWSLQSAQMTWSILQAVPGSADRYVIPIEQAPEEYGYNVIPLHVHPDSCAVIVKFKGHTEVNDHAGWRYGFVSAFPDGSQSRYSPVYATDEAEIHFALEPNESKLYLVVMGAPKDSITTNVANDTWKGYPKHFRFPYELAIQGAVPEGHQAPEDFRAQFKTNGQLHPNGGGWVSNDALVSPSVYVGPAAMVLGNAVLTDHVRISGTAIVRNASISGAVEVRDNALVDGGILADSAIVEGHALAENVELSGNARIGMRARVSNYVLSGMVEVGGDVIVYNEEGDCDNGTHYRLTNYYDNKFLECDGRTPQHPDNADVNQSYALFADSAMTMRCNCANLPDCEEISYVDQLKKSDLVDITPNPATDVITVTLHQASATGPIAAVLMNSLGLPVRQMLLYPGVALSMAIRDLPAGLYILQMRAEADPIRIMIH
jgi:hypothetical protein